MYLSRTNPDIGFSKAIRETFSADENRPIHSFRPPRVHQGSRVN